jgi:FtsZ-binding cell division protein ZapB
MLFYSVALIRDELTSVLAAAAASIQHLQLERDDAFTRESLLEQRCCKLECTIQNLQQHQNVVLQQQELAHRDAVSSLMGRLATSSSQVGALASEEGHSLRSSLAEETGALLCCEGVWDVVCEVLCVRCRV